MNPFTRFLSQWSANPQFDEFVAQWDEVEALAIRVYKAGTAAAEETALYAAARPWLMRQYPRWEARLRPFWQAAKVAGTVEHTDPFLTILDRETAADFVGDWTALQYLPAAREALNRLLVESTGGSE